MLTEQQLLIISAVKSGRNVFITGAGGVGKSTVIKHIINDFKSENNDRNKFLGITATTGAAATLIKGCTIHSYFGIGLGKKPYDEIIRELQQDKLTIWRNTVLLIIDEISMLTSELLEKLDCIGRKIRKNNNPFGGIQIVLSGDFLQLPCINGELCFLNPVWNELNLDYHYLQKIQRQSNDILFQSILTRARLGIITENDIEILNNCKSINNSSQIEPTRIYCKNIDVDRINNDRFNALKSKRTYTYEIEIVFIDGKQKKIDTSKYCLAERVLKLAIGAQVMLIYNIDQNSGLINGSRGIITSFDDDNIPIVTFINGCSRKIDYNEWIIENDYGIPMFKIYQIPLKLAYAITAHKCQGCTLDCAYIDFNGIFEYGQAYVALSRVKNLNNLITMNISNKIFKAHPLALQFYERL